MVAVGKLVSCTSETKVWANMSYSSRKPLCFHVGADEATVPPAGGDMGAAEYRSHLHKETQSHH